MVSKKLFEIRVIAEKKLQYFNTRYVQKVCVKIFNGISRLLSTVIFLKLTVSILCPNLMNLKGL